MAVRILPVAVLLLFAALTEAVAGPPAATPAKTKRPAKLVQAVYPVADLVVPVDEDASAKTLEDRLIRLITDTVAPTTWSESGGRAKVEYYPLGMALVVRQTPAVQQQVADLLASLRRLQDVEVGVEVRIVSVPESFFERLSVDLDSGPGKPRTIHHLDKDGVERIGIDFGPDRNEKAGASNPVFLNDIQVFLFLEAIQGDQRANVIQAPKLTVLNGQRSGFEAIEQQGFVTGVHMVETAGQAVACPKSESFTAGLRLAVQPTVSADRRFVRLGLKVSQSSLDATVPLFPVVTPVTPADGGKPGKPVTFTQFVQQPKLSTLAVERTLLIPDGGTVLLNGGKRVREARNEFGPPVLSKVPYVNRLFKNVGVGREVEHLLVMVTPRIIVPEEEEARKKGTAAEEQEAPPPPRRQVAYPAEGPVAELLEAYHQACADGRLDEAQKLAGMALARDPACFSNPRGGRER